MAQVHFTSNLKRFFPKLKSISLKANTVLEALHLLEKEQEGLRQYLVHEDGSLRKHVNIFVNENRIIDRVHLSDALAEKDEIHIIQALSGG